MSLPSFSPHCFAQKRSHIRRNLKSGADSRTLDSCCGAPWMLKLSRVVRVCLGSCGAAHEERVWSSADSNRIRPASPCIQRPATVWIEKTPFLFFSRILKLRLTRSGSQNHKGLKMRLQKVVMVLLALVWMCDFALCARKSSARKSGECHFHCSSFFVKI